MNSVPSLLSTVLALLCVILSFVSFSGGQKSNSLQADLLKKQGELQELSQKFQVQNAEYQRQTQSINTAQTVVQRAAPVLQNAGYLAAKNKNEKLKAILVRQKLEAFIPTAEQLKEIEKQIEELRTKQGQPASAAPAQ
jgi:DNA-directed RNA polymerase specialized sigma subunit